MSDILESNIAYVEGTVTSINNSDITVVSNSSVFKGLEPVLESLSLPNCTELAESAVGGIYYDASYGEENPNFTVLTTINMPKLVEVPAAAFGGATAVDTINLPLVTTVRSSAFTGFGKEWLDLTLPEVITIGNSAFDSCQLKSITAPKLESISDYGFHKSYRLSEVNAPNLKTIGSYAFYACTNLASFTFDKVETIGYSAFDEGPMFKVVDGPCVKTIGGNAFYRCLSLEAVRFPVLESIGSYAFASTKIAEMNLPATIREINANAFTHSNITVINIARAENAISGAPWGAENATVNWTGTE